MRKALNTSTALIASLSLLAGGPGVAQQTAPDEAAMVCADGSDQPCAEGVPLVPAPAPEAAAEPVTEPVTEPVAEPAPEPEPQPEPAPEATLEPAPAPNEVAPEARATEDAVPEEAAPSGTAPEAEVAPDEGQPAAASPEPEPQPEAAPDQPSATEPAQPAVEPAPATEPDAGEAPADTTAEGAATTEPATEADTEAAIDLPVQPEAATGEAPAAAAAAADAGAGANAEVSEEVVTEDTARSSSEDFANPVNQPAAAQTVQPAAPTAAKKDKGLSDGEKAVLLGLGALAVGAILSNNRKVELNSGDRVVLERPDGSYQIIKDDNALLRQPGATVRTERFDDGSTRTIVTRADGSQIVTIRDAEYRVLRRAHVAPDGTQTLLFDDTVDYRPVDVSRLPPPAPVIEVDPDADAAALRRALARHAEIDRRFSLAQVRDIERVRTLVPVIDLTSITFETGSAAIRPDQADALARIGGLIKDYVDADPREIFLIEGHTDAVGSAASNLALSDRRAESVALALTEYFDVPPENLVVQGYGEAFLKVPTDGPERRNRRASVRRITDLLRQEAN